MRALPVHMLPHPSLAALSGPHQFLVIDGSGSQGPGARGTQYRVHLRMELVPLSLPCMAITDQRTGECLKHFALEPGEVAVADRSSCQPKTIVQTVQQGADVRIRLTPYNSPCPSTMVRPWTWWPPCGRKPRRPSVPCPCGLARPPSRMARTSLRHSVHPIPLESLGFCQAGARHPW
jgi:hypothetical protein